MAFTTLLSILACFVAFLTFVSTPIQGCTVVAVGRKASSSGCTYVAHTDDAGGSSAADVRLVRVPAQNYSVNALRAVYNFKSGYPRLVSEERGEQYKPADETQKVFKPLGYIPQVDHTFAYFDLDYGMMNEKQLSIAESTSAARTVGWASDVPYGYNMFSIAELTKVALERCISSRCAVKVMGELAVKYGFFSEDSGDPLKPMYADSAEALAISDKFGEVWIFHVLTGLQNKSAIWAAQRVPDGHVSAIANGFIIRQMNLTDSDNYMASDGMLQIAKNMGWWKPSDGPFDFTAAFSPPKHHSKVPVYSLYVGRRLWRIFDLVSPSLKLDSTLGYEADTPTYPFSVKPDKKVRFEDLVNILKDHYEGTEYDMTRGIAAGPFRNPNRFDGSKALGAWERPISIFRTVYSFILESRNDLPDYLGGIAWYGQDKPHGTVYVPFSCAQNVIPSTYMIGMQSQFETKSAWRAFNFVNNWAMLRYDIISKDIKLKQSELQIQSIKLVNSIRNHSLKSIGNHSLNSGERHPNFKLFKLFKWQKTVVSSWWDLAFALVGKYSDGFVITGENDGELRSPGYPEWWLKHTSYSRFPGDSYNPPHLPGRDKTIERFSESVAVDM